MGGGVGGHPSPSAEGFPKSAGGYQDLNEGLSEAERRDLDNSVLYGDPIPKPKADGGQQPPSGPPETAVDAGGDGESDRNEAIRRALDNEGLTGGQPSGGAFLIPGEHGQPIEVNPERDDD